MRELTQRTITVNSSARAEWLVIALLIALSALPIGYGAVRLAELAGGAEITPENARFFAAPVPVVLHILSVSVYCVLGAFQFSSGIRRRRPGWHRGAGRLLVPLGLVAALSGLWLTQFYPPVDHDGPLLYVIRLVVGSAMVLFICLGFAAIRRRDIARPPSGYRPAPRLDDAWLCDRPRGRHTGADPSALFPVRRHTG